MRIVRLSTQGVRGLADREWDIAADAAGSLTVVTGPPSCGLTTFLGSVAWTAAALGVGELGPASADVVRGGGQVATIASTWALDDDERTEGGTTEETLDAEVIYRVGELNRADADPALLGLMSKYSHDPGRAKVVLVPARRVTDAGFPSFFDFETDQRTKRFADGPEKFASFPTAVSQLLFMPDGRSRFDAIRGLFGELCKTCRLTGASRLLQPELDTPSGRRLTLGKVSHAERNAFILAAMPTLLGLERSVVLLDTPELGLAPGVARDWIEALRRATPRAQWIVATRDPDLVKGTERAARIDLGGAA